MITGVAPRNVWTTEKNAWPIACWRVAAAARRRLAAPKRAVSASWRPYSFDSVIPETDNVSWVIVITSAVACCVVAGYASRRRPTARVAATNNGTVATVTIVSGHDKTAIATSALIRVTELDSTDDRVTVTAVCTPATSEDRRDCRSPVRAVP